jgi:multiple sugar transport system substrate-binding protein
MATKRLNRRDFLRLGALVGAGAAVAACATPTPQVIKETVIVEGTPKVVEKIVVATAAPGAVVKVTWTNNDPIDLQEGYNKGAEAFNKANAGKIEVVVNNVAGGGYGEKLAAMLAANDAPDTWMLITSNLDYPKRGTVQNLTPFILADNIKREELWFDVAWKRDLWHGQQYHVPRSIHTSAFAYNKTLIMEAGLPEPSDNWTLDDFTNIHAKVRNKDKGTWASNIRGHGGLLWGSGGLPYTMGIEVISIDGRTIQGILDSPKTIEGIQWYIDLQDKYDAVAAGDQMQALGTFPFGSGKLAITGADPSLPAKMEGAKFEWGIAMTPHVGNNTRYAWNDAVPYWMWSGGKHKDETWQFLKFISGVEGTEIMMTSKTGFPSPCPAVWRKLGYDKPETPNKALYYNWRALFELAGERPYFARTEYWGKCVIQGFQGIWVQYLEEKKRPLEQLIKQVAADAQVCLNQQYASEA